MEDPEPFRFSFEKVEETKEEDDDVTALIVLSGSSSTFLPVFATAEMGVASGCLGDNDWTDVVLITC